MSNEICRICLETTNLRFIFDCEGSDLASKIMLISSVELRNDDGLPQFICDECAQKVDEFLEFKQRIENTHQYLSSVDWVTQNEEDTSPDDANCIKVEFLQEDEGAADLDEDNFDNGKSEDDQSKKEVNADSDSKKGVKVKLPIQCNICGKLLSTKFRLKCHMRTHTGEKPFKCGNCEKSFALAYNLKIHQRIHTGEKPLECHVCSKKFTQATGLISHLRLHTGESPYKCHLCPKGFKTTSHLKYHIRLHTGEKNHVCQTCKKAFITKSDLSQHLKIHTGERPHVCNVCGLRLARAYHLERHMITHTGVKKFKCDICGQSYAQNYDLKRHRKIHTNKKILKDNADESSKNECGDDVILLEFLVSEKGMKNDGDKVESS